MSRGYLLTVFTLIATNAQAHLRHHEGVMHAAEHLWLLLALMLVVMPVRMLAHRLLRINKR